MAVDRIVCAESYKDCAVPYKVAGRRAMQRYAVLCGLIRCYIETGSKCMAQCCAIRQYAVGYYVRSHGLNLRAKFFRSNDHVENSIMPSSLTFRS